VTGAEAASAHPILRMERIVKRFGSATALDGVDFDVRRGEVHALVGENGAGKSTLVKILTGAYHRDRGGMWLDDRPVRFDTPADAQRAGVAAVHQEVNLLRYGTVAENVFVGREPRRWGLIDRGRMLRDTANVLARLQLPIDPAAALGKLSTAEQQMIGIARGVSLGARVLVLDEPTSSLAEREVSILYELIRRLQDDGVGVVYISHRFDELYALCQRVTVLRDGGRVATRDLADLDRIDLVALMLGRSRGAVQERTTAFHAAVDERPAGTPPLARVEHVTRGHVLRGVSLEVHGGEVVGLAGLLGSGRTETARVIFGAEPADGGTVAVHGTSDAPRTPRQAIRAGIAYLPEDRKVEGIIPDLSVRENLTLAALPRLTRYGVVSRARQREIVERFMRRLGIKAASADQPVRELSGGNQQKVLLARWLCTHPRLLMLDEPTRGIDIGAKAEIQRFISELAGEGLGVLLISSELDEILEGSSRVVVLRDGRDVATFDRRDLSQHSLLHAMAHGSAVADPPAES
jgi:galactofuranose transport system ATP-binding protein